MGDILLDFCEQSLAKFTKTSINGQSAKPKAININTKEFCCRISEIQQKLTSMVSCLCPQKNEAPRELFGVANIEVGFTHENPSLWRSLV